MSFAFAIVILFAAVIIGGSIWSRVQELECIWVRLLNNAQGDRLLRLKAWSRTKELHGIGFTMAQACAVLEDMQIRGIR
jgi:hypothetical protein